MNARLDADRVDASAGHCGPVSLRYDAFVQAVSGARRPPGSAILAAIAAARRRHGGVLAARYILSTGHVTVTPVSSIVTLPS
ncbi:hypothetical protein [Burkholderia sp. IMCC1007]|uniref:hypothetical protein n=1 Tax=Burkholderia sp. IMCC1007 TaxID=3004104 RepID=UPI0022B3B18B|nr:hypothetical protein [Burkholderia sp. IMCC1007]